MTIRDGGAYAYAFQSLMPTQFSYYLKWQHPYSQSNGSDTPAISPAVADLRSVDIRQWTPDTVRVTFGASAFFEHEQHTRTNGTVFNVSKLNESDEAHRISGGMNEIEWIDDCVPPIWSRHIDEYGSVVRALANQYRLLAHTETLTKYSCPILCVHIETSTHRRAADV